LSTAIVKISTPYMKTGVLYDDFKRYFGHDSGDVLVWRAPSALMNPSLRAERLAREERLDPLRFAREYEAEFAEDLEAFLPYACVDGAVVAGRHELPSRDGVRYVAAVDPFGGGADAFTLAIVHAEGQGTERRVIHNVIRGWSRRGSESVDLESVVREIATIAKRYRCSTVYGDRYAAQWVRDAFKREGIRYSEPEVRVPNEPGTKRYLDKSLAYLEVEPLFAQGRIELLDYPTLARELKQLERRPRAGGKTLVDHPAGGHDDHANALAPAAVVAHANAARPFGGSVENFSINSMVRGGCTWGGTARIGRSRVPVTREGRDCREGMLRQEGLCPVYALAPPLHPFDLQECLGEQPLRVRGRGNNTRRAYRITSRERSTAMRTILLALRGRALAGSHGQRYRGRWCPFSSRRPAESTFPRTAGRLQPERR
jgi:hypothetical protein